jgi:glycogen(starch) synthase
MLRRILHVSNSSYRSLSDAGPSSDIFRELSRDAAEYHVLGQNSSLSFAADRDGKLYLHLVPAPSGKTFALLAYYAAYLIRKHSIDGVVCQDPVLGGIAALHATRLFRIPLMVEVHTDVYFEHVRATNPVLNLIGSTASHVLRRATRVRAVDNIQARLIQSLGVHPSRIVHVPYRVDTRFFQPGRVSRSSVRRNLGYDGEVLIASIGRFVEQKGFPNLLAAFNQAKLTMPSLRLIIVGAGPMEGAYRAAIDQDELATSVQLVPWVPHERMRSLLAAVDIYVQPSLAGKGDWMPRTVLEAMAMGLPIVASSVGGIPDVVRDGRNGVLVPPGDTERLRLAVLELSDRADIRARMGRQARLDVCARYAWDETFERYREALYSLDACEAFKSV